MNSSNTQAKSLSGRHVLFGLLSFFGVVFLVNGVFLSKAISSFPGEITKKSYIQGIHYNDAIERKRVQKALGWKAEVGVINPESDERLLVRLSDSNGSPLDDLSVRALFVHHSNNHTTVEAMLDSKGGGEYSISVEKLESGRWTSQLLAISADGSSFEVSKELVIR